MMTFEHPRISNKPTNQPVFGGRIHYLHAYFLYIHFTGHNLKISEVTKFLIIGIQAIFHAEFVGFYELSLYQISHSQFKQYIGHYH